MKKLLILVFVVCFVSPAFGGEKKEEVERTPISQEEIYQTLKERKSIERRIIKADDLTSAVKKLNIESENEGKEFVSVKIKQSDIQGTLIFKDLGIRDSDIIYIPNRFVVSLSFIESMNSDKIIFTNAIMLTNCSISGDVNFSNSKIYGSVFFWESKISGDAIFCGSEISGDAGFDSSEISGDADFRYSKISGDAIFSNFSGDVDFRGSKISGDAIFSNFSGDADFRYSKISSNTILLEIAGNTDFRYSTFSGDVDFRNTNVSGYSIYSNFFGDADLSSITFSGYHVDFRNTTFSGHVDFSNSTFSSLDLFRNTTFSGHVDFRNSTFFDYVHFSNINFSGDVDFSNSTFSGYHVDFRNTKFSGYADFSYSTFSGDVDFSNSTFSGYHVYFRNTTFSGHVDFRNSTFSSLDDLSNKIFSYDVDLRDPTFSGYADFSYSTFSGDVDFRNSYFAHYTTFYDSSFSGANIRFNKTTFSHVNFEYVVINSRFTVINFKTKYLVSFKNTVLNKPIFDWDYFKPQEKDKYKLSYNKRFYSLLVKHFNESGQYESADEAYYEFRHRRRIKEADELTFLVKVWEWFFDKSCKYGTNPFQILWFCLGVIAFSAFIFSRKNALLKNKTKNRMDRWEYGVFFSLNLFSTIGYGNNELTDSKLINLSLYNILKFFKKLLAKIKNLLPHRIKNKLSISFPLWIKNIIKKFNFRISYRFCAMAVGLSGWFFMALFLVVLGRKFIR